MPAASRPAVVPERLRWYEVLGEAWRARGLAWQLGASVATGAFDRTILGPLWIPIQVGVTTFGFNYIFGRVLGAPSGSDVPYLLFMLVGMFGWRIFDRTLLYTLRSFHRFRRVLRQFAVPLLLIPIAATAQGALEWGVYVVLLAGVLSYYWAVDGTLYLNVDPSLLLMPIGLVWAMLLAWGVGFVTGPTYVRARDVRFMLRLVLPLVLFVTPILYPLDSLTGAARTIAELNPLTTVIQVVKLGAFGTGELTTLGVAASVSFTAVTLLVGVSFLARFGPRLIGTATLPDEDEDAVDPL